MPDQIRDLKRGLRAGLRTVRADLDPTGERAARLFAHVRNEPALAAARVVMAYDATAGEPDSSGFMAWCRSSGKVVVVPSASVDADVPVPPGVPDVVIVPGLGFTADGARLGRGGGWYDRFLAERRRDCVAIGVCFVEQLVDEIPVEAHDASLDVVVTDAGRATPAPP